MTNEGAAEPGLPKEAITLLEWLSDQVTAAFSSSSARRTVAITLSRSDRRRLLILMRWLRRTGAVPADRFDLPPRPRAVVRKRGPFRRGRCVTCGRDVAVSADGKARFHRGSEACRNGGQDVQLVDEAKP